MFTSASTFILRSVFSSFAGGLDISNAARRDQKLRSEPINSSGVATFIYSQSLRRIINTFGNKNWHHLGSHVRTTRMCTGLVHICDRGRVLSGNRPGTLHEPALHICSHDEFYCCPKYRVLSRSLYHPSLSLLTQPNRLVSNV